MPRSNLATNLASTIVMPNMQVTLVTGTSSNVTIPTSVPVTNAAIEEINRTVINTAYTSSTANMVQEIIWRNWNETFSLCNTCDQTSITSASTSASWIRWNTSHEEAREFFRREAQNREARQQAEAQRHQAWVAAEGERAKARDRATKLLQENLSPKQREELAQKGYFQLEVHSQDGSRRLYRIHKGRSGNVKQVDDSGRIIKSLCCHPIEQVPDEDTMLAQKLFLEAREADFLKIANHTNYANHG